MSVYLAFDLGASSGRLMAVTFDGERLTVDEIHRFPNTPVNIRGCSYWDVFHLFGEMILGLKKAKSMGFAPAGIGIDTWGVDYALLDGRGNIVGQPICYRDSRTDGIAEEAANLMPLREIYERTGIQFMGFNTVYQLLADMKARPAVLEAAKTLLFMPDLFGYFLTGETFNEYTALSTSQLLNARERALDKETARRLGISAGLFPQIVKPCEIIGGLSADVLRETGLSADVKFVAVGSHDTASAVAGTPFCGNDGVFLSCGTWSLLGRELDEPIINDAAFTRNFTNEGGVGGKIRFLKNINGLWIIQKLREAWGGVTFGDIAQAAREVCGHGFRADPSDPVFMNPVNMAEAVADYCEADGQGRPGGIGETALAVYKGLAEEYRARADELETLTGKKINVINMVGGGVQDELLCEMTARATGRTVQAGPVEASVLGNALAQMIALGEIKDLAEGREAVGKSFERKAYQGE